MSRFPAGDVPVSSLLGPVPGRAARAVDAGPCSRDSLYVRGTPDPTRESPLTTAPGPALHPVALPANQPADRFYLGGARIAAFRGSGGAPGDHVPEDWVGSTTTVAGSESVGLTVLPDGRSLRAAVAQDPLGWLGPRHAGSHGPDAALLVKLLDAGERLPVHVHPDDVFARQHLSCRTGKTEAWIVLEADAGARVHLGFTTPVQPAQLSAWVAAQDRETMLAALHEIPVRTGDTVYVPAGLPHAIGAGILLLELQQAADLSLLLEYGGFDIDGERDGHLGIGFDTALGCVRHGAVPPEELDGLRGRWDDSSIFPAAAQEFFRADRLSGAVETDIDPGFGVVTVVAGDGRLEWGGGRDALTLSRGTTVLVPYGAGRTRLRGDLDVLLARPPA